MRASMCNSYTPWYFNYSLKATFLAKVQQKLIRKCTCTTTWINEPWENLMGPKNAQLIGLWTWDGGTQRVTPPPPNLLVTGQDCLLCFHPAKSIVQKHRVWICRRTREGAVFLESLLSPREIISLTKDQIFGQGVDLSVR